MKLVKDGHPRDSYHTTECVTVRRADVEFIPMEDALVTGQDLDECPRCAGTMNKSNHSTTTCPKCKLEVGTLPKHLRKCNGRPSKKEIYEVYWGDDMGLQDAAKELGVAQSHLPRILDDEGIPRKVRNVDVAIAKYRLDKQKLYELHWGENKSLNAIAKELNVDKDYIYKYARQIQTRTKHEDAEVMYRRLNKQKLYELYWGEYKSLAEIGEKYGVRRKAVKQLADRLGIPTAGRDAISNDPREITFEEYIQEWRKD